MTHKTCTFEATPNIAVVKYWGKRNSNLNLPNNGSISATMDYTFCTRTSVAFDDKYAKDELVLNGKRATGREHARVEKVLNAVRKKAGIRTKAHVVSSNNFPTAAGIASSASGFAALACAASCAAGLKLSAKELSIIARLGSGSACRSVLGGFVEWRMGRKTDGSDSYAVQIAPASHWPTLRNVVALVDAGRKKIGSEEGMEATAKTSRLYKQRLKMMPKLISQMRRAIIERDLKTFLELTMRESSSMHATMLDSTPPIIYLNDVSKEIINALHTFNKRKGKTIAGYTFDAGPNAHIYTIAKYEKEIKRLLERIKGVKKIIVCKIGEGPRKVSNTKQ